MGLVIKRKDGQKVVIGNTTVTVYGAKNVSLHIQAPADVHIRRAELPENNNHSTKDRHAS